MKAVIIALLLTVEAEYGIPPYFMVSIATIENPAFDVEAVNINSNGTKDVGIMQLNSSWYKGDSSNLEEHARAAAGHIMTLHDYYGLNWWQTAIAYNCGIVKFLSGKPPNRSIEYANNVFEVWNEYR
jgi:hypothetical protein